MCYEEKIHNCQRILPNIFVESYFLGKKLLCQKITGITVRFYGNLFPPILQFYTSTIPSLMLQIQIPDWLKSHSSFQGEKILSGSQLSTSQIICSYLISKYSWAQKDLLTEQLFAFNGISIPALSRKLSRPQKWRCEGRFIKRSDSFFPLVIQYSQTLKYLSFILSIPCFQNILYPCNW